MTDNDYKWLIVIGLFISAALGYLAGYASVMPQVVYKDSPVEQILATENFDSEREGWRNAVLSRDAIIEWYEQRPPKIEIKEVEVIKEVINTVNVTQEKIVYLPEEIYYEPFNSVNEIYEYVLSSEVVYREYKFGIYDCINYDPPDKYYGFALDFIEEAKNNHRYFITDYVRMGNGNFHIRAIGFVGNRLYAVDPNNIGQYPILLGTAD